MRHIFVVSSIIHFSHTYQHNRDVRNKCLSHKRNAISAREKEVLASITKEVNGDLYVVLLSLLLS
jgi:hypothetical protein